MQSAEILRRLWDDLAAGHEDVGLEQLIPNDRGEGSFRFRYLLPMAAEAQFYAALSAGSSGGGGDRGVTT